MNLKAELKRDEKVPIKKVNNRTHFFKECIKLKRSDNKRVQKASNTKRVQNLTRSNQQKSSKMQKSS